MRIKEILIENVLSSLVSIDQKERQEYQNFVKEKANGDWFKGALLYAKYKKRPQNDIFGERERLQNFTQMNFNFDDFSDEDWKNYWLLTQHCDFDRNFQQKALTLIQQYKGTDSTLYQYLYDRISCGLNGTQKYGTQQVCRKD